MNINFENRSDIVRDAHSKAILSTDRNGYMAAKKRKEDQNKYIKLENDVREIKKNMLDISNLLKELLNRGNK
jgi:hypothetical protein